MVFMGEGNKVVASRALTVFVTGTGEGGEGGKGGVSNPPGACGRALVTAQPNVTV